VVPGEATTAGAVLTDTTSIAIPMAGAWVVVTGGRPLVPCP